MDAAVEIIPFSPGRRPTDEARSPWMGSSDQVAFVNAGAGNRCYLLFKVAGDEPLEATISGRGGPLPGWDRRPFTPQAFVEGELTTVPLGQDRPYVLALDPDTDLRGDYSF